MKSLDFMVVFYARLLRAQPQPVIAIFLDYLDSCLVNIEIIILRYIGLRKGYCLFLMYVKFIEKWVEKDEI